MGIRGTLAELCLASAGLVLLCAAPAALAAPKKESAAPSGKGADSGKSGAPASLQPSAYVEQIGGSLSDPQFWVQAGSLIPSSYGSASLDLIIADKGNFADQDQIGANRAMIVQWGTSNSAVQSQSGSGNVGEIVQISPGALAGGARANAGGGNGGEFDIFGFEVDPGNSGAHNQAKEPDGAGSAAGKGNSATQSQSGTANFVRAVQIGWSNRIVQAQAGTQNSSIVVQIGTGNNGVVSQGGTGQVSTVVQTGSGQVATVRQGPAY